ncbi:hypothetical protein TRIATDRAFT_318671 [Trichoderma atroviride IMI 206040]|uniref:C2H2-type domain-containing protein n=1 Tax=Hypocrea atroviridis (strain ATCC 20476 / IMI 206040) TaxID=452589 RepID=G9NVW6_HYPAI|nr:uncharacterized protein TRIATDRAFT_318671 [Trichoderma atroviride IMI 206040]EHK45134.1 hypothetical protein TRIATDRAFT_318671 [Trichoderma atroviride IMI 206040]
MIPSRGENPLVSYSDTMFYAFYSGSDDPWVPAGVIQPAQALTPSRSSAYAYNPGLRGFQDFRGPPVPSDCETALDSGYGGSRTIYSANESGTSVNEGDGYTEGGFHDIQATDQPIDIGSLNLSPAAAASAKLLHCDACGANVKTKSELKKHDHRHNRPYKCDYKDCTKAIRGFSTTNDLTRHKRTVHREHDSNAPTFICRHYPCTTKKEKLWPRADNFRSHLYRSHSITIKADDDLREYRYYSIQTRPHEIRDGRTTAGIRSESRSALPSHATLYTSRHSDGFQGKEIGWPTTDSLQDFSARIHGINENDFGQHRDQPDEAELHALRGVGSSVADVDPESRPTQVQDSPDLRSSQLPTGALSQLQKESSKQSHLLLTRSGCDSQSAPSNTLDGLKLPSALGPQSLVSDVVAGTPVREDSLEESMAALPDDEPAQESFGQDEGNPVEGEDEVLDHHDPLAIETMSLVSSNQVKDSAPQSGIPELQETDNGLENDFRASTKELAKSFDTAKRLKSILSDKDGLDKVLSLLKNIPRGLLEKALNHEEPQPQQNESVAPNDQTGSPKMQVRCTKCHKPFSRACELRKHMKRHEKPYGCTYKTCHKMFGSKNDWKRHESSQHFQMESWNCDEPRCDKVLPRRELFKTHLQQDHQETDSQTIENKLESCRLGRHCDPRFWCGFCDQFIEIKEKVVNSWTKRCDHIDNHLFGKDGLAKKTMADWCYLEDKLAEGDSESSKKPKAAATLSRSVKKRKATDDLDVRSTKRSNVLWICCACNHSENYHVSSQCMNCCHKLCSHCKMEQLPDFEHEADLMSQEVEERVD